MLSNSAVLFYLGLFVGSAITAIVNIVCRNRRHVGALREDRSDPDSPYLFLELTREGYDKIHRLKQVELNVILRDYLP